MSKFTDLIADPFSQRVILVKVEPFNKFTGAVETFYYSDVGFTTEPGDSPANQYYDPRLKASVNITRTLIDGTSLRGFIQPDIGEIVLASSDTGEGDDNTLDDFVNYAFDNRNIEVLLGGPDFSISEFGTIFRGNVESTELSETEFVLNVRDKRLLLDKPIQTRRFAGTGGIEGDETIEGNVKPMLIGDVTNFEPVYVGVVGGLETFFITTSIHPDENPDEAMNDSISVFSDGVELTEVGSSPSPGEFVLINNSDEAYIQLGGSVLDTTITCDAKGVQSAPSTYLGTVGAAVEGLINANTSLTFVTNTVSDFDTDTSDIEPGIYIKEQRSLIDVISELLNIASGYYTITRNNEVELGRIDVPSQTADKSFTEEDILSINRLSTEPPVSKVAVRYFKNWSEQKLGDLASGATDSRKELVSRIWQSKTAERTLTETEHLLSREQEFFLNMDSTTAAQNEADRLLDLFSLDRDIFEVTVNSQPFDLFINDTVSITYDRFDLSRGKRFRIIGLDENPAINRVTMTLWGGTDEILTTEDGQLLETENDEVILLE